MAFSKELLRELFLCCNCFALYCFIQDKIITCVDSQGESMLPTLPEKQVLIVDKLFYKYRGIKKNDIIIAHSPVNPQYDICKRVVYTEFEDVNNYMKVPQGHVWLEGDNKSESFDSRHHGPVSNQLIVGKVIFAIYPFLGSV